MENIATSTIAIQTYPSGENRGYTCSEVLAL